MEGRGQAGSHKVASIDYIWTENSQMTSVSAISTSTYHTKQLNPWPNSEVNCVMNHSRLSACQWEMEPFEGDLSLVHIRQASETSHTQSSLDNFHHQYLAELLVNVYSYCLMVKSVSCCYVHVSWLFSDSVTYICN